MKFGIQDHKHKEEMKTSVIKTASLKRRWAGNVAKLKNKEGD